MVSIVIPAHNEAAVIARTLRAMTEGALEGELDVVVVCNGCTDATADIARGFGGPVRVIETAAAGKPGALNLGDREARGFPRLYVDADVVLPIDAIRSVARTLSAGGALAAAPAMRVRLDGCSWPVRAFYRVWLSRPYHTAGHIGSGVFGLSEAGRRRFGAFPDIIADDEFVRRHFAESERVTCADAAFTICAPRRLWDLVKVKTRSRLGLYQLRAVYPQLRADGPAAGGWRLLTGGGWRGVPDAASYGVVAAVTRARAMRQRGRLDRYRWERDESSRAAALGEPGLRGSER